MVRDNIFKLIASLDIQSIDHMWLLLRYSENDKLLIEEHLPPEIKTIIYQTNRFDKEELKQFKILLCGACLGIQKQSGNWSQFQAALLMLNQEADFVNGIIQPRNYTLNSATDFVVEAIKGNLMSNTQLETLMNALADSISYS